MISIAICGAGPAGLTLARLLQQANVESLQITIFEKDQSPTSRFNQGGTLDLHPKTALAAIRAAGLWDEIHKFARYEGEEMKMGDKNSTVLLHMKDAPAFEGFDARPEIDREKLEEILLNSVDPTIIQWGKSVKTVDEQTKILTFSDGSHAGPFDLVVGAEGAWSKVRNILTDVKPSYSGICGLEASIDAQHAGKDWDKISNMVGQGSYFSFSDGSGLMSQRMGDGSLKLGTWFQKEETWPADVIEQTGGDEEKIKNILLNEYAAWDDKLTQWVKICYRFRPWPLYELPIGHRWDHKKGWTLIGDSAHLMTPFAGEGVNTAMKDALDLSEAIVKAATTNASLDKAVQNFELSMFPRAEKVQRETAFNKTRMFRQDAPIGFIVEMIEFIASETGYDFNKGWIAWLPINKLTFTYFWSVSRIGLLRRYLRENLFSRKSSGQ